MRRHSYVVVLTALAALSLLVPANAGVISYNKCNPPATIGAGTPPNALVVVDMSGSMQFPAYYPDDHVNYYHFNRSGSFVSISDYRDPPYTQRSSGYFSEYSYYGIFDSDAYYVYVRNSPAYTTALGFSHAAGERPYWEKVSPQPVSWIPLGGIQASTVNTADSSITFTTSVAHGFGAGDVVAFEGLTGHRTMNVSKGGGAFQVISGSGTQFTVRRTIKVNKVTGVLESNCNPPTSTNCQLPALEEGATSDRGIDPADPALTVFGKCIKRLTGHVSTGLSGNILNFVATSRLDAAVTALIGGKADCPPVVGGTQFLDPPGDNEPDACFLRLMGGRRTLHVSDRDQDSFPGPATDSLRAAFYIRPGTIKRGVNAAGSPASPPDAVVPDVTLDVPAANTNYTQTSLDPENYRTGPFVDKDMFISIWGRKKGELRYIDNLSEDSALSAEQRRSSGNYKKERRGEYWRFRTPKLPLKASGDTEKPSAVRVRIKVDADLGHFTPRLQIWSAWNGACNNNNNLPGTAFTTTPPSGDPVSWDYPGLTADTEYVLEVTSTGDLVAANGRGWYTYTLEITADGKDGDSITGAVTNVPFCRYDDAAVSPDDRSKTAQGATYGQEDNPIGSIKDAVLRVKVPLVQDPKEQTVKLIDPRELTGVIQQNFDKVRFGFMIFRGDGNNSYIPGADEDLGTLGVQNYGYQGRMFVGCDFRENLLPNNSDDTLRANREKKKKLFVNAVQGYGKDPDEPTRKFYQVFPYFGTPTKSAMVEAFHYFYHNNGGTAAMSARNTPFTYAKRDPYRDWRFDLSSNTWSPDPPDLVPCHKSFVFLVSDGQFSSASDDPLNYIARLRGSLKPDGTAATNPPDIRTDSGMPGPQVVKTFTIFCFDNEAAGKNAMKWGAMYGGFTDTAGCSASGFWPYGKSSVIGDSKVTFAVPGCTDKVPPDVPDECCKEWDSKPKGAPDKQPDDYFYASSGADVKDALEQALGSITQEESSAGAPAAVSQTKGSGDLLIRGVFQAQDKDKSTFLWQGHLEIFLPIPFSDPNDTGTGGDCFNTNTVKCLKSQVEGLGLTDEEKKLRYPCVYGLAGKAENGDPICYSIDFFTREGDDKECPKPQPLCMDPELRQANKDGLQVSDPSCADFGLLLNTQVSPRVIFAGFDRSVGTATPDGRVGGVGFEGVVQTTGSGTVQSGDAIEFTTANAASLRTMLGYSDDAAGTTNASNLIRWAHGEQISGLRDRRTGAQRAANPTGTQWRLSDVVYSSPVVVGVPSVGAANPRDPDILQFYDYRNATINSGGCGVNAKCSRKPRDQMIYVGANDGMLHAFVLGVWDCATCTYISDPAVNDTVGKEKWAYIPSVLLSELKEVADVKYGVSGGCTHRAMVDLSPRAWDVLLYTVPNDAFSNPTQPGADNTNFRTVLIGGLRTGGDVYFALDVTDPDNPRLLWEYSVLKDRVVVKNPGAGATAYLPYATQYEWPPNATAEYIVSGGDAHAKLKTLPVSWSTPYVGRLLFPRGAKFYVGGVNAAYQPLSSGGGLFDPGADPNGSSSATLGLGRHVAFMGGNLRIFEPADLPNPVPNDLEVKYGLWEPNLLALDISTGLNLFKYFWPYMVATESDRTDPFDTTNKLFAIKKVTSGAVNSYVPYAVTDSVALDLVHEEQGASKQQLSDGFVDHLFFGDLNGDLYKLRFRNQKNTPAGVDQTSGLPFMSVDLWRTKKLTKPTTGTDPTKVSPTNLFRSDRQPIVEQPSVSFDKDLTSIRVIFGTGKYEDVFVPGLDDKSDRENMSLYNLKEILDLKRSPSGLRTTDGNPFSAGAKFDLALRCTGAGGSPSTTTPTCTWTRDLDSDNPGDCCCCSTTVDSLCSNPGGCDSTDCIPSCWTCVWEFGHGNDASVTLFKKTGTSCTTETKEISIEPGTTDTDFGLRSAERVVGKPLTAGGIVLVTTFMPTNLDEPCGNTGVGFFYAFDFMCRAFTDGFKVFGNTNADPMTKTNSAGDVKTYGYRVSLGTGVPSRPVLDSSGTYAMVQSGGRLVKVPINLPERPDKERGWKIR